MKYDHLFAPGKIGNLELTNRIVMPPMGLFYGDGTGSISKREKAYFVERAKGGIGLITSSCYAVDEDMAGLIEDGQVSLTHPEACESIADLVNAIHQYDSKFMVQIHHPGRQANSSVNFGQQPVGPSAIKEADFLEMPRELSITEIKDLINKFIKGAKISYELGADGVELHGAHGYLIYQFMSRRANLREDEYGGTFEKRMRFVREIIEGINAFKPKGRILVIRINATDLFEGGLTVSECLEIALYLEKIGVDSISVSNGTYANAFTISEPALFDEGCRTPHIKPFTDALAIPVIAVDHIKRPETAERILAEGVCDFIGLGRATLADPHFVEKARGNRDILRTCISCGNCVETVYTGGVVCSMNPYTGKEEKFNDSTLIKNGNGRSVIVVGGGPGGIEAAITAAKRGFDVTLFDKGDKLGGMLILAGKGKGKEKITWSLNGMIGELKKLGVKVNLNKEVTSVDKLRKLNPYTVIVATGGDPIVPSIPGLDRGNVYLAHNVLKNDIRFNGKKIAVIGSGMTGLETAEVLLEGGNKIVMYDMLNEIANGAEAGNKFAVMDYLSKNGTMFKTGYKLKEVTGRGIVFDDLNLNSEVINDADIIVLSLGVKPNKKLAELFDGKFERILTIGDCAGGSKISHATMAGLEKVWAI